MSLLTEASLVITPNAVEEGKLFSIIPTDGSGDMTAVRATTATLVNSERLIENVAINVPRLDYTNGSCPSILVEPQRTNLVLRSEEFDNGYWVKYNSTIIANNTISPNGTLTADKLNDSASNNVHIIQKSPITGTNQTVTWSVFAKAGEYNFCGLSDNVTGQVIFNLITGENTFATPGLIANNSIYCGNGWWRLSVTFTVTTARGVTVNINTDGTVDGGIFTGTGTSGIYIWGAQLEVGANATSYIPTVASAVTRNADVISKTGIADLIGQTEGVLFVDVQLNSQSFSDGVNRTICSINDNTGNNRIDIFRYNNSIEYQNWVGGAFEGSGTFLLITDFTSQNVKLAISYVSNNVKIFCNGALKATDLSALIPACNNLSLGCRFNGTLQYNGNINSVALWKNALTDEQCISLTTL